MPKLRGGLVCVLAGGLLLALAGPVRAQTVTPSVVSLAFGWQIGAKLPAAQTVSLKVSAGTPAFTVATPVPDLWLIAEPPAGTLPGSLSVQVNPSTLAPGVYSSSVTVTTVGVATPLVIPVTLTVSFSSTAPTIAPATIPLTFPGTVTGTFTISGGLLPATFSVATGTAWIALSTTAGALLPAQSQTVTVTANSAALVPQATPYSGKVTVVTTSNGTVTTLTVSVTFTVNPLLPMVTSLWPGQIPIGSGDTVVTIRGANFFSGTTVAASGAASNLKTTLVASDVLLATVPAPLLAAAGNISVTVTNPAPGGAAPPVILVVGNASVISGITNAASYALGSVSPGEIIAIFGQNIGPAVPVQLTIVAGYAQTSAGGVAVTIAGVAAPLVYASSSQVSVQVPYTVPLGAARVLTLTNGSATPAVMNVDIVAAAPGLFTLNASGAGSALILNFNATTGVYTVNSATNAAKIGDTVVFFVTGEGDYASGAYATETGLIVPLTPPAATGAYPEISPLPTVTMGGTVATTVAYAGPIPGSMIGLMQLNVIVPVGATTGIAAPLLVTIGAAQTQANVTIALK